MPRGYDTRHDLRRRPQRYTVPSFIDPEEGKMEPREGKPPTIENAMIRRAWKDEGAGPDADDSG